MLEEKNIFISFQLEGYRIYGTYISLTYEAADISM